jgi:hypothetical protein
MLARAKSKTLSPKQPKQNGWKYSTNGKVPAYEA